MFERLDIREVNLMELISPITMIRGVEQIYLFGSRSYKTGSPRSDIDLLVYAPTGIKESEISAIIKNERALDIFETMDNHIARSFANDSRLIRDDLINVLDAKLLWSKEEQFNIEVLKDYKELELLMDYDFKMSRMPSYTNEEKNFYETYGHNAVFVIMPFREELNIVYKTIKETFKNHGINVVRADEKEFIDDLWQNVKVYLKCCQMAVAVFDKNDQDSYNPNVALEVGYMLANRRKVCLLKDNRLEGMPTDLISRLYREYDANDIANSVSKVIDIWIENNL